MTRRSFLAAALSAYGAPAPAVGIGVMDGTLGFATDPRAAAEAKRLGFTSIQVTLGRPVNGRLPLSDPALQERWRSGGLRISATYIDVLHQDCLKDSTQAVTWVEEGMRITKALGAPVMMLVFFGKCSIPLAEEQAVVAKRMKELCPRAESLGIVLALENTIPADADLRILDEVKSPALKIWYDIGNATNQYHVEPAQEIRQLGKERICEFHIKDKGWIGEGAVNLAAAAKAMHDIGYNGICTLETSAPSGDRLADAGKQRTVWADVLRREGVVVA